MPKKKTDSTMSRIKLLNKKLAEFHRIISSLQALESDCRKAGLHTTAAAINQGPLQKIGFEIEHLTTKSA